MRRAAKYIIIAALLLGLPLVGAARRIPFSWLLEFPPRTQYVDHAALWWPAFAFCAAFAALWALPFLRHVVRLRLEPATPRPARRPFPWWGWLGLGLGAAAWVFAWTRFPWFAPLQRGTFFPLWLAYVVVVNALDFRRTGRCLMLARPRFFLLLFPASAVFWWFFEYLNRFVQNWHYVGVAFTPLEYFAEATVAFSTVLPAVLSTQHLLLGLRRIQSFGSFEPVRPPRPKLAAWLALAAAAFALACLAAAPNYLFPLLWVAPVVVLVSVQELFGAPHVLTGIARGDWRRPVSVALTALLCGFFWEMWNYHSLAKWYYSVPFVEAVRVFEMPILGYGGYVPFGLECAAVAELLSHDHATNWDR